MSAMSQDSARSAAQRLLGHRANISTASQWAPARCFVRASMDGQRWVAGGETWEAAVAELARQTAYVALDAEDAAKCPHCQEERQHSETEHADALADWQAGEGDFMREQIADWEASRGSKDGGAL